ncbi:MAG TPA: sulfatase, partial [Hyphomicrobium sp.]|nr:sulfatase [Hyphomicrobium sp.]
MVAEPIANYDASSAPSHARSSNGTLSPAVTWAITGLIASGLAFYHLRYEGWLETIVFASSITAALFFGLTFLSRRILFSVVLIALMVTSIVIAADVKRHYIEMVLHSYDIVFYLTSWSTLIFLWADHKLMLLALAGMIALAAGSGMALWQLDGTRISRTVSGALFILCVASAAWASHAKGERRNTLFFWDNQYLASFYSSWSDTLGTLWRGQLMDAARSQPLPPFTIPTNCD